MSTSTRRSLTSQATMKMSGGDSHGKPRHQTTLGESGPKESSMSLIACLTGEGLFQHGIPQIGHVYGENKWILRCRTHGQSDM